MDTVDDTAPEARKIGGWLLVFLILVALRSAAGLFVGAQEVGPMLSSGEYGIAEIIASSLAGLACYWVLAGFGAYAIVSFVMRWPQAVSAGKTYLLASFANDLVWAGAEAGIIALTTSDFSQLSYGFKDLLHSFAFFAIWHTYLSDSERVAAIFPKDRRIALGRDSAMLYGFLAMNAVIAILCFMPVEDEIVPRTDGTQEEDTYYDAITSDVRSPADAT